MRCSWVMRSSSMGCHEEASRCAPSKVFSPSTMPVRIMATDLPRVIRERSADERRPELLASLRRGIARDYIGQVARDTVRLLRSSTNPGELVWEAVAWGAPRAEFGWGHAVASATDCLTALDLFEGDDRALPIVQAIAGISETERNRPVNPLPAPLLRLPANAAAEFRARVEASFRRSSTAHGRTSFLT